MQINHYNVFSITIKFDGNTEKIVMVNLHNIFIKYVMQIRYILIRYINV